MIFNSLEVSERLEVNGSISGRNLEDFLANPSLLQTNEIQSACHFNSLIVDGPIIIENDFNDMKLREVLEDVVYDDESSEINSKKVFQSVEFSGGLEITSGFINNNQVENIMLTDKEQEVNLKFLQGDILFSKLDLNGSFDGVNVTDLEFNSVRTFGDQITECDIFFENPNHFIEANDIQITNFLMNRPLSSYMNNENLVLDEGVSFNKLAVENLNCVGNITGSGNFHNLSLDDLERNRLSKSMEQIIATPCTIKTLTSEEGFSAKLINNKNMSTFKNYIDNIRNYQHLLFSGNAIKDLHVHGDIFVRNLNGHNFQHILENAIWLKSHNEIPNSFDFINKVVIEGPLIVHGLVNDINFMEFKHNMVDRNEDRIVLSGHKNFNAPVTVEEQLEFTQMNKIPFENILMKKDELILDTFNIKGTTKVNNLNVNGRFNDMPVSKISNVYTYDPILKTHIVRGDVKFEHAVTFSSLQTPVLNKLRISEIFHDLIKINESGVIVSAAKTFKDFVRFENGFSSNSLNDLDLKFLKNLILTNEKEVVKVEGDIIFENKVVADLIGVKYNLTSPFVSGCDPLEWKSSSLMIDQDAVISGKFGFKLIFLV